jgi:hypothetical protein
VVMRGPPSAGGRITWVMLACAVSGPLVLSSFWLREWAADAETFGDHPAVRSGDRSFYRSLRGEALLGRRDGAADEWVYASVEGRAIGEVVAVPGLIVAAEEDHSRGSHMLSAIDQRTGRVRWRTGALRWRGRTYLRRLTPLSDSIVELLDGEHRFLRAVALHDGSERWRADLPATSWIPYPEVVVHRDGVYVRSVHMEVRDGGYWAVRVERDGRVASLTPPRTVAACLLDEALVYLDTEGAMWLRQSGDERKRLATPGVGALICTRADNRWVVAFRTWAAAPGVEGRIREGSAVYVFDAATARLVAAWRFSWGRVHTPRWPDPLTDEVSAPVELAIVREQPRRRHRYSLDLVSGRIERLPR